MNKFCKFLEGKNLLESYFIFLVETSEEIARLQVCYLLNFSFLLLLHSFMQPSILNNLWHDGTYHVYLIFALATCGAGRNIPLRHD
jgi:hypothetical protein